MTDPVIGFDARMVHHSGIGTHIRGITQALSEAKQNKTHSYNFTFVGDNSMLQQYPWFADLGSTKQNRSGVYSFREQFLYPKLHCAFYHFPHYNVPQRLDAAYVVTVHDLIHLLFPEVIGSRIKWKAAKWMLQKAVARASAVFTVSHWTKKDLIEKLGVLPQRISITENAVHDDFRRVPNDSAFEFCTKLNLEKPFLLAVGINKPHKNFPFLIRSFAAWQARVRSDHELVFCGVPSGGSSPLAQWAEQCAIAGKVRFLPYVSHSDMPALYQSASALVFPSLYEGFGLPVLEAQRLGTPVVASRAACIPEVAGEGALFFDPSSQDDLVKCLEAIFGGDNMRQSLIEKGYVNERRYSWKNSAKALIKSYETVLNR